MKTAINPSCSTPGFLCTASMLLLLCFAISSPAFAHKVNVFAYVEGDSIHVEGFFPDGKPCVNSGLELVDSEGKVLAETVTDENGMAVLTAPSSDTDVKVILNAGMGHRAEFPIPSSQLPARNETGKTTEKPAEKEPKSQEKKPSHPAPAPVQKTETASPGAGDEKPESPESCRCDEENIRQLVEEVVSEEMAPVMVLLREQVNSGPSVAEIAGGIGYIVGLMGLWLFFISRKKNKE